MEKERGAFREDEVDGDIPWSGVRGRAAGSREALRIS
jgi:hypothetical protein